MAGDGRFDTLLHAALQLTAEHDADQLLERIVRCAADVAGARYAALGVLDETGRIGRFVHHGMDAEMVARIGACPQKRGLLGEVIDADGPVRVADLRADRRAGGFPPHHPEMRSFLGVPVRVGGRRFGNLYLTDKRGGSFDEDDERLVTTLAAFAAAAIENTLLVATERDLAAAEAQARFRRELLARVIDAQEAERARVARDLHDQIGQSLTAVLLGLRLLDGCLTGEPVRLADAGAHSDEVRSLVAHALSDVRHLAFELRPTVLDDVGLIAAIRRLALDVRDRAGVEVDVDVRGVDDQARLPVEVETVMYRVVQEALTNVARHAGASRATVEIAADQARVMATVVDDGAGFDVGDGPLRSLGLAGMRERAALVGGHLDVVSAAGRGTTVILQVPR